MRGGMYRRDGDKLIRVGGTEDHKEGNRPRSADGKPLNVGHDQRAIDAAKPAPTPKPLGPEPGEAATASKPTTKSPASKKGR